MRAAPQESALTLRWIRLGIGAGLTASLAYPLAVFAPLPELATVVLAASLGPAIGVASLGLRELLELGRPTVSARVGAVCNFTAGALFSAMALVQLAARIGPGGDAPSRLVSVWLGLDVAWDVYIALGTLFFALAMRRHPRFGMGFAVAGLVVAVAVLVLNLMVFPHPPAEVGLVDVGPLVGLWYLAVTIRTWRSLAWARQAAGA